MASLRFQQFLLVLLASFLLLSCTVKADNDEEENLFKSINSYRASLNLTAFTENDNAECLADKIADQFKKQPCTNTTGSYTVPGTESQFSKYPQFLEKCHLNINDTKNGVIMPVCVPKLDPALVLTNFTQTQYSAYVNDTKFTGAGVGSEDDWIVMVLTTSTPGGAFSPAGSAASVSDMGFTFLLISSFLGFFLAL
ncbi:hypothetical protein MKW94_013224 [Papaver nudicaule]|uniref:Uncharacterized GPI-anchored protein At5g19230-like domain-containing protein n=1 Tax=Papaver nudicaule TaxID=74823 RepID=A0AA41VJS0_PAPNU|nr:hypothetical protein [Papaver nudicaule]